MIVSPVLDELIAEMTAKRMHRAILGILEMRFGSARTPLVAMLPTIQDDERLQQIIVMAATCSDLDDFHQKIDA